MSSIQKPDCLSCGQAGQPVYHARADFLCGSQGSYRYLRCPGCALLWVSPQPTPDALLSLYEAHYGEMLDSPVFIEDPGRLKALVRSAVLAGAQGYPGPGPLLRMAGRALSALPPLAERARYGLGLVFPPYRPGGRLLDIGCGHGWYVKIMRDWGWDAMGVEADPDAARTGRELYGVPIRDGTLEGQRFPDASFDAVAIRHVFEHVPDPPATLQEIRRVLKPGGWLGMAMPNGVSLASRWFQGAWRGACPPWHLHLFGPRSLRLVLLRAGFSVRRVRTRTLSAHWVYEASRQIQKGTFQPGQAVASNWWFHLLELSANALRGDLGEELEAVAERPLSS
jgi:SAM-dependent methyltransferase